MFAHDKIDLIGAEALAGLMRNSLQLISMAHKGGMLSGPVSECVIW